jgi:hypothetical protein
VPFCGFGGVREFGERLDFERRSFVAHNTLHDSIPGFGRLERRGA